MTIERKFPPLHSLTMALKLASDLTEIPMTNHDEFAHLVAMEAELEIVRKYVSDRAAQLEDV